MWEASLSSRWLNVAVELRHHRPVILPQDGGSFLWWCHGGGCYWLLKARVCSSVFWPNSLSLNVCLISRFELLTGHESEYTQVFNINLTVEVILTPDFRWLFGKPFVYRSYDANFKREEPFAIFWELCLSHSSGQNRKAYICTASLNYCGVIFAAKP